jgi:integrase
MTDNTDRPADQLPTPIVTDDRRLDDPTARERRQAAQQQHAVPSRARRGVAGLHRCRRPRRGPQSWLFRTARGHNGSTLFDKPMTQPDAWRMIRRRAAAAGIAAEIGCHTFRATRITAYLANGSALEHAQEMAAHGEPAHDQAL